MHWSSVILHISELIWVGFLVCVDYCGYVQYLTHSTPQTKDVSSFADICSCVVKKINGYLLFQ